MIKTRCASSCRKDEEVVAVLHIIATAKRDHDRVIEVIEVIEHDIGQKLRSEIVDGQIAPPVDFNLEIRRLGKFHAETRRTRRKEL